MRYLNDTCIFLQRIKQPKVLDTIISYCHKKYDFFCITDFVFDEIKPGPFVAEYEKEKSAKLLNSINQHKKKSDIEFIEILSNEKYKENYDEIRKRYYTISLEEARSLIKEGRVKSMKEIKEMKNKHKGECSCIAVALDKPQKYIIVSDDNGEIFKGYTNLFKVYEQNYNIKVWDFGQWIHETKFKI